MAVLLLVASITSLAAGARLFSGTLSLFAVGAALATGIPALALGIPSLFAAGLRYRTEGNDLVVELPFYRRVIPLASVVSLSRGDSSGESLRIVGLNLPGCHVGRIALEDSWPSWIYGTTLNPSKLVLLATEAGGFALTPADADGFRRALIQRLRLISDEEFAGSPAPYVVVARPVSSLLNALDVGLPWAAAFGTLLTALSLLLWLPADVPDTNSPFGGNANGTANDWTSTGQTFVPRWNGLRRVSLILAIESPVEGVALTFQVKESPTGEPIRTVKLPLTDIPQGIPYDYRPGGLSERWVDFDFEPIPDSAGRKLYFSVEGKDIQRENSVQLYMNYHNEYKKGEAYRNEKEEDAHVVFRTQADGRVMELLAVIGENLTRGKSGPFANPLTYVALAFAYAGLSLAVLWSAWRTLGGRGNDRYSSS